MKTLNFDFFHLWHSYLLTFLLTYSLTCLLTYLLSYLLHRTESFWEANRFSATQEIPRILWHLKIFYRIHNCPPPIPILSQLDPVHTATSQLRKIYLNITFPSTPGTPKWSVLSQVSPPKLCICLSSLPNALNAQPIYGIIPNLPWFYQHPIVL
jgi:hypothetical protein